MTIFPDNLVEMVSMLTTLLNLGAFTYLAFRKLKPQVKKLDAEVDSEIVESANLNLEGAKISAQMLLDRINELKTELDSERNARKDEQARNEQTRRDDAEYFRRRIKDVEREAADLRHWASKLVKQVVDAGQVPAPFLPSYHDSDTKNTKPRPDLEAK